MGVMAPNSVMLSAFNALHAVTANGAGHAMAVPVLYASIKSVCVPYWRLLCPLVAAGPKRTNCCACSHPAWSHSAQTGSSLGAHVTVEGLTGDAKTSSRQLFYTEPSSAQSYACTCHVDVALTSYRSDNTSNIAD